MRHDGSAGPVRERQPTGLRAREPALTCQARHHNRRRNISAHNVPSRVIKERKTATNSTPPRSRAARPAQPAARHHWVRQGMAPGSRLTERGWVADSRGR